jgi:hypothetical protein
MELSKEIATPMLSLATGVADSDFDRRLARRHGGDGGKYKITDV